MALAYVFMAFSELVTSVGMSSAVVQHPNLTERHKNVAQTIALVIAFIFLGGIWGGAEAIGQLLGSERLIEVLPYMAAIIWLGTVSSVSRGLLMRDMNFKQLMIIDFTSHVFAYALVSLSLAFLGYGIWSLVLGTLAGSLVTSVWLIIAAPIRYRPRLSKTEVTELGTFSTGMALNNLIGFMSAKSCDVMIGKYMGDFSLGLYSKASTTANLPFMKIALTISSVMFSAYSSIQNDRELLKTQFLKAIRLVSATSIPVLLGLAVSANYVILGLFGEQWGGAVSLFQIACIGGVFNNVLHLGGAVIQSTNNVYKEVKLQAFTLVVLIFGLWFAAENRASLEDMAWIVAACALLLYVLIAQLVFTIIDCGWGEYLKAQIPGLVISTPVVVIGYLFNGYLQQVSYISNELGLLLMAIESAIVYLATIVLLPDRMIGGIRAWVLSRYQHKIPKPVLGLLQR